MFLQRHCHSDYSRLLRIRSSLYYVLSTLQHIITVHSRIISSFNHTWLLVLLFICDVEASNTSALLFVACLSAVVQVSHELALNCGAELIFLNGNIKESTVSFLSLLTGGRMG